MVLDFVYCPAWPDDLKELNSARYRAYQRVRNLEAHITRVNPEDFYAVMLELEHANDELRDATVAFQNARRKWDAEHNPLTTYRATI